MPGIEVKPVQTGPERPAPAEPPKKEETSGRPEWLPENFSNGEQLVSSYKELQAELTRLKQGDPPKGKDESEAPPAEKPEEKPEERPEEKPEEKPEGTEEETKVAEKLKADGVDVDSMVSHFQEHGDITPEHRETLVKSLSKDFGDKAGTLVDEFVEAKKLAMEYMEEKLYAPLGGKDGAKDLLTWAKANLTEGQATAINTMWESQKMDTRVEGSKLLRMLYDTANGVTPKKVVTGDVTPQRDADVYESIHALSNDMADPRYKTDPDYRKRVEAKAARSNI